MSSGFVQRGRRRLARLLRGRPAPSRYDVDPLLPDLPKALDLRWVAKLFEQGWPDGEGEYGHSVRVHHCELLTARHWPGTSCVTTYLLQAERAGQGDFSIIGVVETTTEGCRLRLFSPDPELPFLAAVLDDSAMLGRFVALPEVTESLGSPESLVITPVRYWPGSRCTLRYDLRAPAGSLTCYGKVLARVKPWMVPALDALYEHSQCCPAMLRVPRLLAYWPELHMLVQQGMPGEPFQQRVFDPAASPSRCREWLRACGTGLAALQECQGLQAPVRTLSDEAAGMYKALPSLTALRPAWAERAKAALGALQKRAAAQVEPPPVASHGAFKITKLLVAENGLALIDLDTLCLANAASDVASFLAHLDYMAMRRPRPFVPLKGTFGAPLEGTFRAPLPGRSIPLAEAKRTFLLGYQQGGGRVDEGWLRLYQAAELLRQALHSARNLGLCRSPQATERLLDKSAALLGQSG